MLKNIFLYILALVVLLAPAIILGWIGWSLLGWPGLVIGIIAGLVIFIFSMNRIASQEAAGQDQVPEDLEQTAAFPVPEEVGKRD